jgi:hypothetical protein
MPVLTPAKPTAKGFSWSYSRLHSYELCPRRHHETQILKIWPEETSEHLQWGDKVHKALAAALKTGEPLAEEFADYQHWIKSVNRTSGVMRVEDDARMAIDIRLRPVPWFHPKAWLRVVADVTVVDEEAQVGLAVDWKTGKSANVDVLQLTLVGLSMLAHYPTLEMVRSDFIWLSEDSNTSQIIERGEAVDVWAELFPRINKYRQAIVENDFPPKPGNFCRSWCPCQGCEFHGK